MVTEKTDTPRPSADEIRALVERTREVNRKLCESGGRSWTLSIPVRETDPDVTIATLCDAVESLLEDRELLDWFTSDEPTYRDMERMVAYFNEGLPLRETIRGIRSYRRAALKQAVGA